MNQDRYKHQRKRTAARVGYSNPQGNNESTAIQMRTHIQKLQHELFYLWSYIGQEGLWNEAKEYLDENKNAPTLFELP